MSVIKIEDVAYVGFTVPDLDQMEAFLADFGLERAARSATALYSRGGGGDPFVHVARQGAPAFAALGLRAGSVSDLERLAKHCGVEVEANGDPGGGRIVRLRDPDGFAVEAVAGRDFSARGPLPSREPTNDARVRTRKNAIKRVAGGPSHVQRLGHCVLNVSDFRASERWYKERFGFITSDEISVDGMPDSVGAFMRCDRGELPTDHHSLVLVGSGAPKFNHAAFEVADFDDLMTGHDHLSAKGRHHEWGIGRHILGSQIFDYWRDPWGHTLEHWTDGDLLTAADGSNTATLQDLMAVQWGPSAPPTMA